MKDAIGNTLEEGDLVVIKTAHDMLKGRVRKLHTGGTLIPINQQQAAVTPARVEIEVIVTSDSSPDNPIFTNVLKLVDPDKQKSSSGLSIN